MTATIVLIALALLILFWGVGAYKRLLRLHRQVKEAFAQLGVQMKRRHEQVPDLIGAMKEHCADDIETLDTALHACTDAVDANIKASDAPSDATALQSMAAAEVTLTSALRAVMELTEGALKDHAFVMRLCNEFANAEESIAFAWQMVNHTTAQYNAASRQFPSSIVAVLFAFRPRPLLPSFDAAPMQPMQPLENAAR